MDTPIKGFLKFFSVRFDGSDFGNPEYSAHLSSGIQILNAMTNRCPRADRLRSGMHSPASLMTAAYACRTMPPNASYGRRTGRKNWTFAGSDEGGRRADDIYSLIATAKLNDIDPQAWLADVARTNSRAGARWITDKISPSLGQNTGENRVRRCLEKGQLRGSSRRAKSSNGIHGAALQCRDCRERVRAWQSQAPRICNGFR